MAEKDEPRIYLDVCCLNRPFDDQSQGRIRLEAEAVILILENMKGRSWTWLGSRAITLEVDRNPDRDRRRQIQLLLEDCDEWITVGQAEAQRAREIEALGFSAFDALHLACAEQGGATIFLTTDDRLLRRARRQAKQLGIRVENVLRWFVEVTE